MEVKRSCPKLVISSSDRIAPILLIAELAPYQPGSAALTLSVAEMNALIDSAPIWLRTARQPSALLPGDNLCFGKSLGHGLKLSIFVQYSSNIHLQTAANGSMRFSDKSVT